MRFEPAIGAAVNRVVLGSVLLAHSVYLKAVVFSLPGTADYFASLGLPRLAAYAVFAVEVAAGIALILGYRVRLAATAALPVLLGATWAHLPSGWLFTNEGGGWEYPLVLASMAFSQLLLGAGAFAPRPLLSSGRSGGPADSAPSTATGYGAR